MLRFCRTSRIARIGFVAVALYFASAASAAPPAPRALTIRLAPQTVDGRVDAIAVTETFDVPALPAGAPLLSLPILVEAVPGVLRDPDGLTARDAAGPLPLRRADDPADPAGVTQKHRWLTGRATSGTITVRYLARPREVGPHTRPGALKDMRAEGAGIHGSTEVLFAVPEGGWPRKVGIEWDLAAMAPGARAVTSFGEGDTSATLDAKTLGMGYFMAGPWQRLAPGGDRGFLAYYLTPPDFDLSAAVEDVAATYRHAAALFGTEPQPFRAFMRTTDRFQGGGTGGWESFMFGTVKGAPKAPDELNNLLTHETMHNWIGNLQSGPEGLWFVEGATNYYTALLPFRTGRRSVAQVAAQIAEWTSNYYPNPWRTKGDDDAAAAFWSDTDAQLLPYSRGALYIALVDARLRAASRGRRRVDTLVREMVQAMRRGEASEALWLSLVTQALGESGRREFEDMKAGRLPELPADLFGPCLRRVAGPVGQFRPGLRIVSADDGTPVAGEVKAGSPAAAAGLRQGDRILNREAIDEAARHVGASVALRVAAADGVREVRLSPWVGVTDGFSWVPVTPQPKACGL